MGLNLGTYDVNDAVKLRKFTLRERSDLFIVHTSQADKSGLFTLQIKEIIKIDNMVFICEEIILLDYPKIGFSV